MCNRFYVLKYYLKHFKNSELQCIISLMRFTRDKFIIVSILKYINIYSYIILRARATKIKKNRRNPEKNLETLEEKKNHNDFALEMI